MHNRYPSTVYLLKTKNLSIKNILDLLYEDYGINDFALSTYTSWESGPFGIYPSVDKRSISTPTSCNLKSEEDLLLEQYLRIGEKVNSRNRM